MALLISIGLVIGYVYLVWRVSKNWFLLAREQDFLFKVLYGLAVIFPGLMLLILLKGEQNIYVWDYAGYWKKAIIFNQIFFENSLEGFREIYTTINHSEYNYLPNLLLTPFNHLFGLHFWSYVFSIYLVYVIPLSLLTGSLMVKIFPSASKKLLLWVPLIVLVFTPLILPVRYGFIDVVGLVPIFIILNILLKNSFLRKKSLMSSIYIGLALVFLVFARRWYSFWAVGFFAGVFLVNLLYALLKKNKKVLWNSTLNLFIAGSVSLLIILIFFYPFFEMSALEDYRSLYSGYRKSGYLGQVKRFFEVFGVGLFLVTALGGAIMFKKVKSIFLFFVLGTTILSLLFMRVNDFGGYQHYYLVLPTVLPLFIYGFLFVFKRNKWSGILILCFLILNNLVVFGPLSFRGKQIVFTTVEAGPIMRPDYRELKSLIYQIKEIEREGYYTYSLLSSEALNNDIFQNADLPKNLWVFNRLFQTQNVDKRDDFPIRLFMVDFVIASNPTQVHLKPEDQQVVHYFNEEIINGSLSNHYEVFKTYRLGDNIEVSILKKQKSFSQKEIDKIRNHFRVLYPDFPNMYDFDDFPMKVINVRAGDSYGEVFLDEKDRIPISPGKDRPSEFTLELLPEQIYKIEFTTTFSEKDKLVRDCNPDRDGEVFLNIYKDGSLYRQAYLTHHKDSVFSFKVQDLTSLKFEVNKGKNEDYCDWFIIRDLKIEIIP